jgi:hypothetical protein
LPAAPVAMTQFSIHKQQEKKVVESMEKVSKAQYGR